MSHFISNCPFAQHPTTPPRTSPWWAAVSSCRVPYVFVTCSCYKLAKVVLCCIFIAYFSIEFIRWSTIYCIPYCISQGWSVLYFQGLLSHWIRWSTNYCILYCISQGCSVLHFQGLFFHCIYPTDNYLLYSVLYLYCLASCDYIIGIYIRVRRVNRKK